MSIIRLTIRLPSWTEATAGLPRGSKSDLPDVCRQSQQNEEHTGANTAMPTLRTREQNLINVISPSADNTS